MGLLIKRTPSSQTGFSEDLRKIKQNIFMSTMNVLTKKNPNLTAWILEKLLIRKKLKTYMTKIEITLKKNPIFTDRIHHKLIANYTI